MALFVDPGVAYGRPESFGPAAFDNLGLSIDAPVILASSRARGPISVTTTAQAAASAVSNHSPITVEINNSANNGSPVPYDLHAPFNVSWSDPIDELGDAQFDVMNSDDYEGTYLTMYPIGTYIRMYVNGAPAVTRRVTNYSVPEVTVDDGDKNVTVFMADPREMFLGSKVRTRRGIVSRPFAQLRNFGWQDELDASSWPRASVLQNVISWYFPTGDPTQPPFFTPWEPPRGWPDPYANVIWSRPGVWMPSGKSLFRRTINTGAGFVQMWAAALDKLTVYIDGVKIGEHGGEPPDNGWVDSYIVTIYLSAGDHEFAWEVDKYDRVYPGPVGTLGDFTQRAMLAWTLYRLPTGEQTVLDPSLIIAHSDFDTYCLDYPAVVPAPTWGAILWRLIAEGIARGTLPASLTVSFTVTHDSEGQPWSTNTEKTFRGSDSIWDVMQSAMTDGVDIQMGLVGLVVHAVDNNGYGNVLPLDETPDKGLVSVTRQERGFQPNTLFVQWAGGVFQLQDTTRVAAAAAAGFGIIEDSLELADVRDESAARARAGAELHRLGLYEQGLDVELADTFVNVETGTGGAYKGFRSGDWITVNSTDTVRIKNLDVAQTDSIGNISIKPQLISQQEDEIDRMLRMLDRTAPGTLNGQSSTATPIRWLDDGAYSGKVVRFPVSDFSQAELIDETEDPVKGVSTAITFLSPMRLCLTRVMSLGVPTERIDVRVRRNGVDVVTMYLDPLVQHAVGFSWYLTFNRGDILQVALVDRGEGGGYLSVALLMVPASPAEAAREPDKMPWL